MREVSKEFQKIQAEALRKDFLRHRGTFFGRGDRSGRRGSRRTRAAPRQRAARRPISISSPSI